ncbi:RNA-dependent RNA polymerase [Quillaja saponaria]|uniref:RNA-dependent RNA polymerase n=1 Tax=Quillaja saponaria TaxID=32244 RepID=A0AAD7L9Z6_QUISA|nr:RNA-dependent RNA polymerase [Quillaja saponaria]
MGKTIHLSAFPSAVTAHQVQVFLEHYTGENTGENTIYAIKIRQHKDRAPTAYAIVQFTTIKDAAFFISLPEKSLWYGKSYLKAREAIRDIESKPRTYLHSLEDVTLYFGCQISKEKFAILWKGMDVTLNFGIGMQKLHFFLSHNNVKYRLELSHENIWKIELRQPRGRTAKYLLIQLYGVPRIFENDVRPSVEVFDNPLLNFFKDIPDDQWQLPNFQENFAYYEESERNYTLESGSPFSCNQDLVPIVGPPAGIEIPYEILFRINLLVQHGCLAGTALDVDFYRLVDPRRIDIAFIEHALDKLYHSKEFCYEPSRWLTENYRKYLILRHHPPMSPSISLDAGLVYVRRVQITPCKVYFSGPEVNVSNRVLRHFREYINDFIRVSFVDEELDKMYSDRFSSTNIIFS